MIVIYVYDHTGRKQKTQFFGVEGLVVEKRLSGVSEASFFVSFRREDGSVRENFLEENFQEYNRLIITKIEENTEKIIFEGYIALTETKSYGVQVTGRCLLGLCEFFVLKNGIDFRGVALRQLVEEVFQATGANSLFSFQCNSLVYISKKYEIGRSLLDILQDLNKAGYDFVVNASTMNIVIDEMVGSNRAESVEYVYDESIPHASNIHNIIMSRSAGNIANYILTKVAHSPPYSVQDDESIEKYGRREKYITVNADEGVTPTKFLEKHKDGTPEMNFEVLSGDFWECELGDVVSVSVSGNPLLQYRGITKIIGKSYSAGNINTVNITTSMGDIRGKTLASILQNFEARIATVERSQIS